MMPVGAKGDNAPAFAPFPAMIAIRNSGIPMRVAVAIASGTTRAAVAMLPGPIDDSSALIAKNIRGTAPRLPWHALTARWVSRSRVPLQWASENRSVTPVKVRKSWPGNPPITVFTGWPPMTTPTIHASASARTPMFTRLTQLRTTASARALTERTARFMRARLPGYDSPCRPRPTDRLVSSSAGEARRALGEEGGNPFVKIGARITRLDEIVGGGRIDAAVHRDAPDGFLRRAQRERGVRREPLSQFAHGTVEGVWIRDARDEAERIGFDGV